MLNSQHEQVDNQIVVFGCPYRFGATCLCISQQVKDAQVLLNGLGLNAGPEDGLNGEKTNSALIEFYSFQQKTFQS